ncbi:MAG: Gfo/Idh/MocA family oxidoreductase [Chloroflexi bacterium]|nr:Gfo/Idh/MocA family oxidoreductase [Chloroflexota bacterium]
MADLPQRAPTRPTIRIGVIGAGSVVATRHLPNLKRCPAVDVAAICRRDAALLDRVGDTFGVPLRFTRAEAMLAEAELDAVVIASPPGLHAAHVRAALERGRHVFVEKPFVVDPPDGEALVALAAKRGLALAVGFDRRGHGGYRAARRVIRSGELGAIRHVSWALAAGLMPILRGEPGDRAIPRMPGTHSDPALAGGGILINVGSHLVDSALWLTGLAARHVSAHVGHDGLPVEVRAGVVAHLGDDVTFDLTCEASAPGDWSWDERGVVYGTGGALTLIWPPPRGEPNVIHRRPDGTSVEVLPESTVDPMANFVAAIRGEDPPLATGAEALETARFVHAAYRAAREGSVVTLMGR